MNTQTILVLDFMGQYKELIARKVRDMNVYSHILPGNTSAEKIKELAPIGIILTGGPHSVYEKGAPQCDKEIFSLGIPVLGICYGQQLMCHALGGVIESSDKKEYGQTQATVDVSSPMFEGLRPEQTVLMSHTDAVTELPQGFVSAAHSRTCKNAAVADYKRKLYGLQFHPEVEPTPNGIKILENFVFKICGAKGDYTMGDFIETQIEAIRKKVGNKKVLLGLSGGVDSSVCAALISRAIGRNLYCIFVDHGLMRLNEGDEVEQAFKDKDLNFIRVNAEALFLEKLKGVTDPETKRKIIGREFVNVFNAEAEKLGNIEFLAQGTIYPDVIESGSNNTATIKSHHNVGGLPENIGFEGLVEPLATLFKNEVRAIGAKLGLPEKLVNRQPFPGPGLAIRVIGEITKEKLDMLRKADAIYREEIDNAGVHPDQYFAALTNMRSVGVMGDGRTYEYAVALRAVSTKNFMTATYVQVPYEVLGRASERIVNEVQGINRVLFDITGKPPATIEYE